MSLSISYCHYFWLFFEFSGIVAFWMSRLIFWDGRTDISFEIYIAHWIFGGQGMMLLNVIDIFVMKRWGERESTATEGGRSGSYHGRFAGQGGGLAASQERSWGAKGGAMGGGGCMRLFRYAIGPWYAFFFEDPSGHFVLGLTWFDWQQEKILFVPRSLQNSSWTRRKKAGTFLSETLPLQSHSVITASMLQAKHLRFARAQNQGYWVPDRQDVRHQTKGSRDWRRKYLGWIWRNVPAGKFICFYISSLAVCEVHCIRCSEENRYYTCKDIFIASLFLWVSCIFSGQGIDARLARVRESTSLEQYLHLGGYIGASWNHINVTTQLCRKQLLPKLSWRSPISA